MSFSIILVPFPLVVPPLGGFGEDRLKAGLRTSGSRSPRCTIHFVRWL